MSDTLVDGRGKGRSGTTQSDDDVPDTLSDPHPPPKPAAAPPPKRRSILFAALAGVAVVLGAVALGLYLFVLRYDATARRHIPGNAHVAVRVDFARIILFGPVREHLWPLVTGETNGPPPKGPTRLEKIRAETGVDLARDGRELVVASTDGSAWVAVLGGRLEKGRFVRGLARVAAEERWQGFRLQGDLLLGPGGVAIAQADDGAIIVGSNTSIVTAAIPASDEYRRLDLADDAALSFAIAREAWSGASGVVGVVLDRAALGRIERATGKLTLGDAPQVSLRVEPRQGQPAKEVAGELETALGALRLATLLTPDFAGEKSALAGAAVSVAPDGATVLVTAPWPYEGLDRGCARLATLLRATR